MTPAGKRSKWASLEWTKHQFWAVFMLFGLLFVLLIYTTSQTFRMRHQLDFIDELEAENDAVHEDLVTAKDYLESFGGDLNEIREYLLLPTSEYDFTSLEAISESGGGDSEVSQSGLVLEFINELGGYEENKALYDSNLAVLREFLGSSYWGDMSLEVYETTDENNSNNVVYKVYDTEMENAFMFLYRLEYDGSLSADDYIGNDWTDSTSNEDATQFLEDVKLYLNAQSDSIRSALSQVASLRTQMSDEVNGEVFQTMLTEMNMNVTGELEDEDEYYYVLNNEEMSTLAKISLAKGDGTTGLYIYVATDSFTGDTTGVHPVAYSLENIQSYVDSTTSGQAKYESALTELEALWVDPAFISLMSDYGYVLGDQWNDGTYMYYALNNNEGVTIKVFQLNMNTGELQVKDPEGEAQSLAAAIDSLDLSGKKKLWIYPRSSQLTLA